MGNSLCACAKAEFCNEIRIFTKKEEILKDDSKKDSPLKRNLSKVQNDNQHTTNEISIMAEIKQYFNIDLKTVQVQAKKKDKDKDKKIKKNINKQKLKKLQMAHTMIGNQYEFYDPSVINAYKNITKEIEKYNRCQVPKKPVKLKILIENGGEKNSKWCYY